MNLFDIVARSTAGADHLAEALLVFGGAFLVDYIYSYRRLANQGHSISSLKIFLYVSTGAGSIYTWGFNTWGEAFFIMNLFHAIQYFGLVWIKETKQMMKMFRLDGMRGFGRSCA